MPKQTTCPDAQRKVTQAFLDLNLPPEVQEEWATVVMHDVDIAELLESTTPGWSVDPERWNHILSCIDCQGACMYELTRDVYLSIDSYVKLPRPASCYTRLPSGQVKRTSMGWTVTYERKQYTILNEDVFYDPQTGFWSPVEDRLTLCW